MSVCKPEHFCIWIFYVRNYKVRIHEVFLKAKVVQAFLGKILFFFQKNNEEYSSFFPKDDRNLIVRSLKLPWIIWVSDWDGFILLIGRCQRERK